MREIKFRGWDEDNEQWVYGWLTKLVEGARRFWAIIDEPNGELTRYYIHSEESIGQYTGLKDKDEVEIYEGDADSDGFVVSYVGDTNECLGMNCGFYWQRNNFESWFELECADTYEIIGNIHQNPELLES